MERRSVSGEAGGRRPLAPLAFEPRPDRGRFNMHEAGSDQFSHVQPEGSRTRGTEAAQGSSSAVRLERGEPFGNRSFRRRYHPVHVREGKPGRCKPGGSPREGSALRGSELAGRNLRGADLTGILAEGADLRRANCSEASLERARLRRGARGDQPVKRRSGTKSLRA